VSRFQVLKRGQVVATAADVDAVYAAIRLLCITGQRPSELRYRAIGSQTLIVPSVQP
jgi:hypothetical protein